MVAQPKSIGSFLEPILLPMTWENQGKLPLAVTAFSQLKGEEEKPSSLGPSRII
jgi:hypothetical protein